MPEGSQVLYLMSIQFYLVSSKNNGRPYCKIEPSDGFYMDTIHMYAEFNIIQNENMETLNLI
jgi:hypothetical protein